MGRSARVLHVVNYDYDPTADRFKRKKNITVSVKRPPGQYEAAWIRPGDGIPDTLPAIWVAGFVEITIPSLTSYGILSVQKVS